MSSLGSFHDASSMRAWIIASSIPIIVLAVICLVLRLTSRRLQGQSLWWDDKIIIFSTVWFLIICVLGIAMFVEGVGLHSTQVGHERDVTIAKLMLAAEVLYGLNLCWTKVSILLMYWRIFNQVTYFKAASIVVGVLVLAWGVVVTFACVFLCVPVQKSWDPTVPGRCVSVLAVWTANAASTILTDVAILVLPLPKVWRLQLRTAQKVALTLTFALGFFVVFVSTYRFIVLFSYDTSDSSYTYAPVAVWSLVEIAAGIISANLPLMGPVAGLALERAGVRGGWGFLASRARQSRNKSSYAAGTSGRFKSTEMLRSDLEGGAGGVGVGVGVGVGRQGSHPPTELQALRSASPGAGARLASAPSGDRPGSFKPRTSIRVEKADFERLWGVPPEGIEVRQEFGDSPGRDLVSVRLWARLFRASDSR